MNMTTQSAIAAMMARLVTSAWSEGCVSLSDATGMRSYRIVATVAENIALIVSMAIATRVMTNSHEAASATSFCCEASHSMKDSGSAASAVPIVSTAVVPNMHIICQSSMLAP